MLQLHPADNVAIALEDGLGEGVAIGHKLASRPIAAGEPIIKYGQPIGTAIVAIKSGAHVHVHNVSADVTGRSADSTAVAAAGLAESNEQTFSGFRRANGSVGTRNYVGIVSTVNCSATVVRQIISKFRPEVLQQYPNVDGLCPITHSSGCGMSGSGAGIDLLRRTLGGYIKHPNMGAVLVVGLGCEVNDISSLLHSLNVEESENLRTIAIRDVGGTRSAIDMAESIVEELLSVADCAERCPVPVSAISLALQCGGSDSFSGVSANPALGYAADRLVAAGGTVILGETPEIYGAEHLLLDRAASPAVAEALQERLDWRQQYVALNGASPVSNTHLRAHETKTIISESI